MIFVGCASRSPAAYERGINYPGASVWSLLRPLSFSLPAPHPFHHALFPLSLPSPSLSTSDYLIPPAPAITPHCRTFIPLRLARSHRRGVSVMTPRGGTIPEVKSRRRNHDVHSMESLSSAGARAATHARSLERARQGKSASFDRHSRERESRASSSREEKSRRVDISSSRWIIESAAFRRELIGCSEVKAPGFRDVNIRSDTSSAERRFREEQRTGKKQSEVQEQ